MVAPTRSDTLSDSWRDGIFNGKVVFCTGGAGDICSGQVRAMVFLGADACIIGRNVQKTESMAKNLAASRPGAQVLGYGGVDVRDYNSLQSAVDRCVAALGGIDFVIAGAAGTFLSPITSLSPAAFKAVVDIDLVGSYNTLKATLPALEKSASKHTHDGGRTPASGTGGRIIFISATLHYRGTALITHGSAAKAGVDTLSSCTAIEFGPRGITSNIIAPGPIAATEGTMRLMRLKRGENPMKGIPAGRWGTVKDVADATIYLFADTGSYMNGTIIVVDGGHWRTHGANDNADFPYPNFLLSRNITGVGDAKL
ncbi:uncharacterized protein PV07_03327 [Cladophialophora immunda]|uniref:2,4-dienoyl-CoA reductase [(3E)-enoyl-CoA-producing] n=1 Tax=Cladophialophora immunda TaxID=569365 RepID=A0A0D2B240_9EURO|nr:uncharacterized protein PV07_03327 [Cladophialophora immunda]KIW31727.1 hypothetical protein PV07_03327 [Cladophialophora immunda]